MKFMTKMSPAEIESYLNEAPTRAEVKKVVRAEHKSAVRTWTYLLMIATYPGLGEAIAYGNGFYIPRGK